MIRILNRGFSSERKNSDEITLGHGGHEQKPLAVEEQKLIITMLREFKHHIQNIDNQVTIPLNEAISYTDPVTSQTSELGASNISTTDTCATTTAGH